jgi:putative DNA primase/helicase
MYSEVERIRDALQFVDSSHRPTWLRMGMAVKSEHAETGFEVWEDWSRQADSFNPKDARDVWRSIRPGGKVTIGTLFYEAMANGWRNDGSHERPKPEVIAERRRLAAERAAQEEAEIACQRADTATKAAAILKAATEVKPNHPYLLRKRVSSVGTLREIDASAAAAILGYPPNSGGDILAGRLLVVPVKQGDGISTLELIDGEKRKAALKGRGSKSGGYWATERLPDDDANGLTLLIGEGVATVLSGREATGHCGIAALSSGSLRAVANVIRERFPAATLIILADLVKATGEPDPCAIEAALCVGGKLAIPDFGSERDLNLTDFNDMATVWGSEAVERSIANACEPARGAHQPGKGEAPAGALEVKGWSDPHPLVAKVEREPYPLDALPLPIRAAVEEVVSFVKAPVPMVASSALAALSIAIQAHLDAKRLEKLHGPVGLFILVIADSGERKSTCDGIFTKSITEYEEAQAEASKPALRDHRAAIEAWEAKRGGVRDKIRQLAKDQKSTAAMESVLRDLEHDKPEPPRIPRLLYADATPEALAFGLAKQWPSGGVVSAEAGIVFGSHGMGKDSVMRNLGLLNQLWDGKSLTIDRRSTDSFTVRGARLTVALQVQEPTLREFFTRSGALARGTGFLARFLVAWPESTQGMRQIDPDAPDGPATWPHLAAFHRRIAAILDQPVPIDEDGALTLPVLSLTPEAKAAWVEYHNAIESELPRGGELYDVRDVASKSADNAARLAALFQVFEGAGSAIGLEAFESASLIAAWHLHESRRFLGDLALPAELADAARLDGWLIEHCRRERTHLVSTREAQRIGPIREREKLAAALRELEELDRVKVTQEGRRKAIKVHPALVGVLP